MRYTQKTMQTTLFQCKWYCDSVAYRWCSNEGLIRLTNVEHINLQMAIMMLLLQLSIQAEQHSVVLAQKLVDKPEVLLMVMAPQILVILR